MGVSNDELQGLLAYVLHVSAEYEFSKGRQIVPDERTLHSITDTAMRGLVFQEEQADKLSVYHALARDLYNAVPSLVTSRKTAREAFIRTTAASYIQAIGNLRADGTYLQGILCASPDADKYLKAPKEHVETLPAKTRIVLSYLLEDMGEFSRAAKLSDFPPMRMRTKGMLIMSDLRERLMRGTL